MFCYILILVKVRKLLDMGFLIKMILFASTRFFKSENPTVEDLVKLYVKLATPPKSNLEKVRLMYRHNLKGNSTNLCPAHPEHRRNSTRRCTEQFSSSPNRPPTRGLFGHWYQIGSDRIFGSVRFGNSADFSRFGKVRFRFRLSEY